MFCVHKLGFVGAAVAVLLCLRYEATRVAPRGLAQCGDTSASVAQELMRANDDQEYVVRIKTSKNKFAVLEPVVIDVETENRSPELAYTLHSHPVANFAIDMLDLRGKPAPFTSFARRSRAGGASAAFLHIEPAKTRPYRFILNHARDVSVPGAYSLRVSVAIGTAEQWRERTVQLVTSDPLDLQIEGSSKPIAVVSKNERSVVRTVAKSEEGYELMASLREQSFAQLEPVAMELALYRRSAPDSHGPAEPERVTVSYECQVVNARNQRPIRQTRFGKSNPYCTHPGAKEMKVGDTHVDGVLLNQFFDLSDFMEYEVRLFGNVKIADREEAIKLRCPPLRVKVTEDMDGEFSLQVWKR